MWGSSAKHTRGQKVGVEHVLEDEDGIAFNAISIVISSANFIVNSGTYCEEVNTMSNMYLYIALGVRIVILSLLSEHGVLNSWKRVKKSIRRVEDTLRIISNNDTDRTCRAVYDPASGGDLNLQLG